MNKLPLQPLLEPVISLCREAGDAILNIYHQQENISYASKEDHSPVTQADLAAHNILTAGLAELIKGTPILSEEGAIPDYSIRKQWSRYWLIDPLDGTREFIERGGEFTVNVALIENGRSIFGVVHTPMTGITYYGGQSISASKLVEGQPQPISTRVFNAKQPFHTTISRRRDKTAINQLLAGLKQHVGPIKTLGVGSSLKFCLVAEGLADFYPCLGPTSEWDTAAAQAIVEAAGGQVINTELQPLSYNQKADLINPNFYAIGDSQCNWKPLLTPDHQ